MDLFRLKLESALNSLDWVLDAKVPDAPGTTPIPGGYVRLYHYTRVDDASDLSKHRAAESLRRHGILISESRGETYGEPNVVWASTHMPGRNKVFAEFALSMDDPRWVVGKPPSDDTPEEYMERGWDCFFSDSIRPEEIIAVHEPWHYHYRYILENDLTDEVRAGEFNHLLGTREYGPAVRKVLS